MPDLDVNQIANAIATNPQTRLLTPPFIQGHTSGSRAYHTTINHLEHIIMSVINNTLTELPGVTVSPLDEHIPHRYTMQLQHAIETVAREARYR